MTLTSARWAPGGSSCLAQQTRHWLRGLGMLSGCPMRNVPLAWTCGHYAVACLGCVWATFHALLQSRMSRHDCLQRGCKMCFLWMQQWSSNWSPGSQVSPGNVWSFKLSLLAFSQGINLRATISAMWLFLCSLVPVSSTPPPASLLQIHKPT